jgi:ssDNA-binding Zn-finger/Zn-ribbon topoisomerase 1
MKQKIKCAKCGKLLAEIVKKSGRKREMISYASSVQFDLGGEKNLAWAVCSCGHKNAFDPAIPMAHDRS